MQYHVIEPEVPGGFGTNTVLDRSVQPSRIGHLHYQFDGWLGDDLVKSHPVFLCSMRATKEFQSNNLSGYELADVEVTTSSQFRELHPQLMLPAFRWLKITGKAERDDFGLREDQLVVSDRALSTLQSCSLNHARIRAVSAFPWDKNKQMDELFEEARAVAEELKKRRGY